MKSPLSFFLVFALLLLLLAGCRKNEVTPSQTQLAYIIGFHPCTAKSAQKGFVLELTQTKDTVVTYNLPDSLYQFPKELFRDYQFYFLFSASERKKYPLLLTYRETSQSEKLYVTCTADINLADFQHFTKGRQIVIKSARRTK